MISSVTMSMLVMGGRSQGDIWNVGNGHNIATKNSVARGNTCLGSSVGAGKAIHIEHKTPESPAGQKKDEK